MRTKGPKQTYNARSDDLERKAAVRAARFRSQLLTQSGVQRCCNGHPIHVPRPLGGNSCYMPHAQLRSISP